MIHTSHSLEETQKLADQFVSFLSSSSQPRLPDSRATLFGFSGDLGSGKTSFTQCVAHILGIQEKVTSPTFVIQKKYEIPSEVREFKNIPFKTLVHIDAYRLERGEQMEVLKFKEECEDPNNLIIIEWPEKVASALPQDLVCITFSFVDEYVRTITFPDMMSV